MKWTTAAAGVAAVLLALAAFGAGGAGAQAQTGATPFSDRVCQSDGFLQFCMRAHGVVQSTATPSGNVAVVNNYQVCITETLVASGALNFQYCEKFQSSRLFKLSEDPFTEHYSSRTEATLPNGQHCVGVVRFQVAGGTVRYSDSQFACG